MVFQNTGDPRVHSVVHTCTIDGKNVCVCVCVLCVRLLSGMCSLLCMLVCIGKMLMF